MIFAMTTDLLAITSYPLQSCADISQSWHNIPAMGGTTLEKSAMEKSYDMELQQGRNITQASLSILHESLDVLIFSSLAAVKRISKGKYAHVRHFDAKGDAIAEIKQKYPELAKKTAALILGYFMGNWKGPTPLHPAKVIFSNFEIDVYNLSNRWHSSNWTAPT